LILLRLSKVEIFGMARGGSTALLPTVKSDRNRRCALKDPQAIKVRCGRRLTFDRRDIRRKWSLFVLSSRHGNR